MSGVYHSKHGEQTFFDVDATIAAVAKAAELVDDARWLEETEAQTTKLQEAHRLLLSVPLVAEELRAMHGDCGCGSCREVTEERREAREAAAG